MTSGQVDLDELATRLREAEVHTVELALADTQGHLRGKRIPVEFFLNSTVRSGANIADAIFVFDIQNDLPDNPFINMDSGYLDTHLTPDRSTLRVFTHRPGYALVFADATGPEGRLHPLAPRSILRTQVDRCAEHGLDVVVATEMECYLCHPDGTPIQVGIQYSTLIGELELEAVLADIRSALIGAGMVVESSNCEYGPGQVEVNVGPADAMTTADNTVLFKSIVKQVALQHGYMATFMPKPWAEQSGSGMHVHTSLSADGANAFASSDRAPNELMGQWLAGLLTHATAISLLASPTPNGTKRVRPYTFAPTHVTWGGDNRTVLARCITEAGSAANRVEFRSAGADANPYLFIAGVLAAGIDGVNGGLKPFAKGEGDLYTNPGDHEPLPADYPSTIEAFADSELAGLMGDMFARSYVSIARAEQALAAENAGQGDEVNEWERARYMEHS